MKIAIGSDHRGFILKREISIYLNELGINVDDYGTFNEFRVDYPDIAFSVCESVAKKIDDMGILICGTGIGMSIAANKVKSIRAAKCNTEFEAVRARQHNNANILCLGSEVIDSIEAKNIVKAFLNTPFADERHQDRIIKIERYEKGGICNNN